MSPPVAVDGFYEAVGPHAVQKSRAEYVLSTAYGIIGRYAAHVTLNSVRGVRLPLEDKQPINFDRLRIKGSQNLALITGRMLETADAPKIPGAFVPGCGGFEVDGDQLTTKVVVWNTPDYADPTALVPISSAVHEGGHAFGLSHCVNSLCIMQACGDPTDALDALTRDDPFCGRCIDKLESGLDAQKARALPGVKPLD